MVLRHADSTFIIVFFEHFPRVLAVHVAKVGVNIACQTLWENVLTTSLQKSSGVGCFLQLHVDYHDHINGSFMYC